MTTDNPALPIETTADRRWRYAFYAIGIVFLTMFAVVSWQQNGPAFVLLVAAALCFIASRLVDITKFKLSASGIEAELRDVLADAKATVVQLHFLAEQQAKFTLHLMQSEGRFGGGDPSMKSKMRAEILSMLRDVGLSQARIDEVTKVEHPWIAFDYSQWVTRRLTPPTQERSAEWNAFFHGSSRRGVGYEPSPAELRAFLGEVGTITEDVDEKLKDYDHFVQTKTHRRPEVWNQRFD